MIVIELQVKLVDLIMWSFPETGKLLHSLDRHSYYIVMFTCLKDSKIGHFPLRFKAFIK